ncbi:ImmA/IrrE family metallo-endopeptidase [Pediococcus acidilactici]|nr:ImmA/IrrE family metallo-endopeptidase [Pediococcus acidilactici]KAF0362207.1 ImmA/IrrE family metallo-endopeptidase [Pediococcus acidilactici]KAF0365929.1 ImmA/IrrE family metallo-endopeptidase [Pediococcus acidilactici]KAF0416815.1 ImmA/IrrE family metallo-endopeptidase [Pediococcus acidilactici]KAF0420499.1 ImmA/IrrE family metallo-endopeptidase [Pediococcus acidilactici]
MVFMNNNWPNKQEIPFQFAHEISHVLNGDSGSNNFAAPAFYSKEEFNANKRATRILLEYCDLHGFQWDNVIDFMDSFSIPMRAKEAVKSGFKEYISEPYNVNNCTI